MSYSVGSNLGDMKAKNQNLVLKLIATREEVSRASLARMTGLTKTTLGNIVADLIAQNIICDLPDLTSDIGVGRKPILLDISSSSPCIMGILIKRGFCTAILADLKGRILDRVNYEFPNQVQADQLLNILMTLYSQLCSRQDRHIAAIGIASAGPVDSVNQVIMNPPNFYGITNLPVTKLIQEKTGTPAFLISDGSGGALAEKLYGQAKGLDSFVYLHIMNGIGAGFILDGKIYNGTRGQVGEVGHTSIDFSGPVCDCGNTGCLELYANLANMNQTIRSLQKAHPKSSLLPAEKREYTWQEIVNAAAHMDYFATAALDEFCGYLSCALVNVVNLLDVEHVILGYDAAPEVNLLEAMLEKKMNARALSAKYRKIKVVKSVFGEDAPLLGSVAVVANKIFEGDFRLF